MRGAFRLFSLFLLTVIVLGGGLWGRAAQAESQGTEGQDDVAPGFAEAVEETAGTGQAVLISKLREEAIAQVRSAVKAVSVPDAQALGKALGIEPGLTDDESLEFSASRLAELDDLDGDGVPEWALKWAPRPKPAREPGDESSSRPAWILFLLAWDGTRWRVSHLWEGFAVFTVQTVPVVGPSTREIVVVLYAGAAAVPYPAVFQFKDHSASLLWDGGADQSRYQGYPHGRLEFRDVNGDELAEVIVSGRADPGLLIFPQGSKRGFEVRAVYSWDGKAYVPRGTEYAANPDYALYRFISALHLRDFRSAYALIDPPRFLKTDQPNLEIFRQHVENSWPEFLGNHIFEIRDAGQDAADDYAFQLSLPGKLYVYRPTFSDDAKRLLIGLERREEK